MLLAIDLGNTQTHIGMFKGEELVESWRLATVRETTGDELATLTVNFDAVSADGEYLGGVIAPGIEMSLEALHQRTAKLPEIDLAAPESAIGHGTLAAIQSGIVYGFAGGVDGILTRIREELGDEATAIATGGMASVIVPHCEEIDEVDDLLTLTGLRIIWERNRS